MDYRCAPMACQGELCTACTWLCPQEFCATFLLFRLGSADMHRFLTCLVLPCTLFCLIEKLAVEFCRFSLMCLAWSSVIGSMNINLWFWRYYSSSSSGPSLASSFSSSTVSSTTLLSFGSGLSLGSTLLVAR